MLYFSVSCKLLCVLVLFASELWHLCLSARIKTAGPSADMDVDSIDSEGSAQPIAGLMEDAYPANFYGKPHGDYVRLNVFRIDHTIKEVPAARDIRDAGDLSYACTQLRNMKMVAGAEAPWLFGSPSILSVYRVDVKLDVLRRSTDDHRRSNDGGEHNVFRVQHLDLLPRRMVHDIGVDGMIKDCRMGDKALESIEKDFRSYTLKAAVTQDYDAAADPHAEWKNLKYIGTLDLYNLFPESAQAIFPNDSQGIFMKSLDVISQRIEQAFSQASFGYGRAHEKLGKEKCSDKIFGGDSFGSRSCETSWKADGRCAWVFQVGWRDRGGFCVPNCRHAANNKHPVLCLSRGPCQWNGEGCDFDPIKAVTVESSFCRRSEANFSHEQSLFCRSIAP